MTNASRLILLFLLLPFVSFSQVNLKLAPTVGINFPKIIYSEADFNEDMGNSPTLNLGVKAYSSLSTNAFYQTGLFYSQKGKSYTYDDGDYDRIRLHYAEVPINLGYRINMNQTSNFSLYGGPYVSFAFGGRYIEKFDNEKYIERLFNNDDYNAGIRRFDGGLNLGVNYEYNESIIVALQQSFGLISVDKSNDELKARNRVLSLSISYVLP